jgi:hypothetical protein
LVLTPSGRFSEGSGSPALGRAKEVRGKEGTKLAKMYLAKPPRLEEFVSSPACTLVRIRVKVYFLVRRFQNVFELKM